MQLTEAEWFQGIQFLTDTGQKCSDIRQEFILLSDTLGVSMVVDLLNHQKPQGRPNRPCSGRSTGTARRR